MAVDEQAMLKDRGALGLRERMILGWGKLRRLYLSFLRPAYVRASLARRVGECHRTGACCKLMFTCPLLDQTADQARCSIHESKPRVCRQFPIDERDLRDRDILSPGTPCGYSFIPWAEMAEHGAESAGPAVWPRPATAALPR
jgi:hypothetical protein